MPEARCFPQILLFVAGLLLLWGGEVGGRLFLAPPVRPAPEDLSPATFLVTGFSPEFQPLFFRSVSEALGGFWSAICSSVFSDNERR